MISFKSPTNQVTGFNLQAVWLSGCNVTIHNRCRDSVANCAKMKQKVRPVSLLNVCPSVW